MAVTFDASGLDALAARLGDASARVVARVESAVTLNAHDVVRIAQAIVGYDSGALQAAIGIDFDPDGMGASIGPTPVMQEYNEAGDKRLVNYGPFVEHGTRAHAIYPRLDPRSTGRSAATYPEPGRHALSWPGIEHPVREVQHPGTAPHPFMGPAGDRVMPKFVAEILAAARTAI